MAAEITFRGLIKQRQKSLKFKQINCHGADFVQYRGLYVGYSSSCR